MTDEIRDGPKFVAGRAEIEDLDAFLAEIDETADEFDCAVQAFDADYVVGEDHLRAAVERADRAFDRGENVARERAVEILLYAAGRRQIDRALRMGVSEGENRVVVVVHSPEGDDSAELAAAETVRDLLAPASAAASADAAADAGASEGSAGASSSAGANTAASADEDSRSAAAASASADAPAADRIDRGAVREFFDVSEAELAATDATLGDLVRERVALLNVEK
ncbi:KEOPS complex subunit Cgi121 [Halorussus litoreus]|uniref:KEOPS complex subunit Cgi121 n=1 Tax=Halorussus litoreus TaxID=1710536 RepID=UPI001E65294C|nr:KEOPS complex subunit Cgi121 [Halorussus litoreus]